MPDSLDSGYKPNEASPHNLRTLPVIATSIFCVSLLTGCLGLMIYYSDKQHAISRVDRQRIADKEARVEGTLYGQSMMLDRMQKQLDSLERRMDSAIEKIKTLDTLKQK